MVMCEGVWFQVRELFLKHKAAELDREMGIIKDQEEAGRHVRMLTNEIRSTLDRHTILNTTLVELAKTLALANCTIWEPSREGDALKLTHELDRRFLQVLSPKPCCPPCAGVVRECAPSRIVPALVVRIVSGVGLRWQSAGEGDLRG